MHKGWTKVVRANVRHFLVAVFQCARKFLIFVGCWCRRSIGLFGMVLNGLRLLLLLGLGFSAQDRIPTITLLLDTPPVHILRRSKPVLHMICSTPGVVSRLYVLPAMAVCFHCLHELLVLGRISYPGFWRFLLGFGWIWYNMTDWNGGSERQSTHFFLGPVGSVQSRIQAMTPSLGALWFPTDQNLGQRRKKMQYRGI